MYIIKVGLYKVLCFYVFCFVYFFSYQENPLESRLDQPPWVKEGLILLILIYETPLKLIFGSLGYPVLPWQRVCQGVLEIF